MELRHLLYFKTVAEELHFRKAASRLFISQPPLSRQIRELEEELGVQLFERNNKRVKLTDAGLYFKKEVDAILGRLTDSQNMVKQIHHNLSGQFNIGYISSTYHTQLITVLKEMRQEFPFLKIRLFEVPTVKQVQALNSNKLDVGIMRTPVNTETLKLTSLFHDPFVVVMPQETGGFTTTEALSEYLQQQPFIFFNGDYAPDYHRKLVEICQRLGFQPDISHEANNVHSILRLVESGIGVSILPKSLQWQYPYLKLRYYNLDDIPVSTEVVLASRHSNEAIRWFTKRYADCVLLP
ncbi:LysR family transcriptional regulator [Pedobacter sp. BS3]|uniref:LysR family transcriptional regulator n=1 Tax=Pedobacter sp. BS3 TaxID=2567937 RepID=UPI0011ED8A2F|nr:LysR substrate-binding domain-containing protein [Pedobacter sp. BS3]TZF83622.1 LysR family transcriptional regulator [Pedobacter sp. BS3]